MQRLAPAGPVYQAGTLSGNPIAVAAGLASLRAPGPDVYAALDANARRVGDVWPPRRSTAPASRTRCSTPATSFSVFFAQKPVTDFAAAQAAETFRYPAFFHAMLEAGVYLPPSAFEAWFVNAAMDDAVLGPHRRGSAASSAGVGSRRTGVITARRSG